MIIAVVGLFVISSTNLLQASFIFNRKKAANNHEASIIAIEAQAVEQEVLFSTQQMSEIVKVALEESKDPQGKTIDACCDCFSGCLIGFVAGAGVAIKFGLTSQDLANQCKKLD